MSLTSRDNRMMTAQYGSVRFYAYRPPWLWFAGAAVFVVAEVFLISYCAAFYDSGGWTVFSVLYAVTAVAFGAWMLNALVIEPLFDTAYLQLDEQGFCERSLFSHRAVSWADVASVGIGESPSGVSAAALVVKFTPQATQKKTIRAQVYYPHAMMPQGVSLPGWLRFNYREDADTLLDCFEYYLAQFRLRQMAQCAPAVCDERFPGADAGVQAIFSGRQERLTIDLRPRMTPAVAAMVTLVSLLVLICAAGFYSPFLLLLLVFLPVRLLRWMRRVLWLFWGRGEYALILDRDGFEECVADQRYYLGWSEVACFHVHHAPGAPRCIAISFPSGMQSLAAQVMVRRCRGLFSKPFPDLPQVGTFWCVYGKTADELSVRLNACIAAYRQR